MKTEFLSIGLLVVVSSFMLSSCGDDNSEVVQFDRTAIPAVNAAVIPAASKDAFNAGDPSTDLADFTPIATARIDFLRTAVNGVAGFPPEDSNLPSSAVAMALVPDVLSIDLSQPLVFPNGRGLPDDVIDVALGLVLNRGNPLGGGPGVSDGIANDSTFLPTFPYLGVPQN